MYNETVRNMIREFHELNREIDLYVPILEKNCDIVEGLERDGLDKLPLNRLVINTCMKEISRCHAIILPLIDKSYKVALDRKDIYKMLENTYLAILDKDYDNLYILEKELNNYI